MELGRIQKLKVLRKKDFGVYLGDIEGSEDNQSVLLPIRQVEPGVEIGDVLEAFIYKDSSDRLIATVNKPLIQTGELKVLKIKQLSKIGAFIDIGLERDVLLPFKEMEGSPKEGDRVLAALYIDKSERLAATMKVYKYLVNSHSYKKDDEVTGIVYRVREAGVMVAVDEKYFGMLPSSMVYESYAPGDVIKARVIRVREDGKLDLSTRKKAYLQIEADAIMIEEKMKNAGGRLDIGDKSETEAVKKAIGISKNAFKRAAGHLLKKGRVSVGEHSIELTDKK